MKYIKSFEKAGHRAAQDPFIQASKRGSTNKIKEFIKNGVDVNMVDSDGSTALMHACLDSYLIMVDVLLRAGANPNLQNKDGRTALMYSSTPKIITKLLEAGANPNLQDMGGNTIVMDRLLSSGDIVTFLIPKLLEYGLDFNIKNKNGLNFYELLMWCIENRSFGGLKQKFLEIKKYMDDTFPLFGEEWEMQRDAKKYNL